MSEGGGGGDGVGNGKLDRWLSRQKDMEAAKSISSQDGPTSTQNGAEGIVADTQSQTTKPTISVGKPPVGASPRSPAARGSMGGVGACCNLIRLLDPDELKRVHEVLVGAMREKKVQIPELPSDIVVGSVGASGNSASSCEFQEGFERTPMVLTPTAGESIAMLTELLEEVRKLGSEAAQRVKKHKDEGSFSVRPPTARGTGTGPLSGDPRGDAPGDAPAMNEKMSRWLSKVAKNKQDSISTNGPESVPTDDSSGAVADAAATNGGGGDAAPTGKLSRWMKRVNPGKEGESAGINADVGTGAGAGAQAVPNETPGAFVKRACATVRRAWACGGGGNMTLKEEWEKLKLERASLDALMQMVTAVKETPEKVTGDSSSCPSTPMGNGNNGHTQTPNGTPGSQPTMQRSVPNPGLVCARVGDAAHWCQ